MVLPGGGVRTRGKAPNWSHQVWEVYERITGKQRPPMFESTRDAPPPPRNDEPPL